MNRGTSFILNRTADYERMSHAAADWVAGRLKQKPGLLVVLATGSSPERTYQLLAARGQSEPELFRAMRVLKLDEWGGLAMDDPATCEMALRNSFIDPLRITPDRVEGWHSKPADTNAECERIRLWLEKNGPPDLCVLGLGLNGHLGFNEPGAFLQPGPHRATLSPESMRHAMLQQAKGTPGFGLTLGIKDILQCREILLLVSGEAKRRQLERLLTPEVTPEFPASFLWLHPAVTIFCDEAALPKGA